MKNSPKIAYYPHARNNPYQEMIRRGVLEKGGFHIDLLSGEKYRKPFELLSLKGKYDVIHFHWIGYIHSRKSTIRTILKSVQLALVLLKLKSAGLKLIITLHNLVPHDRNNVRIQVIARKYILKLFHHVIFHSESAGDYSRKVLDISVESTVIPHPNYRNCYPDKVGRSSARDHFDIGPEKKVMLFFGTIRPYKNIEKLLEYAASDIGADTLLVIAGSGDKNYVERLKESVCSNVIIHDKYIPDDQVQYYFRCADCFVIPSSTYSSLTSGSAVLSLTFMTPIMAPDTVVFREFIGRGLCVPTEFDSSTSILSALEEISGWKIGEFERRCENYLTETDIGNIARLHSEIYRSILRS